MNKIFKTAACGAALILLGTQANAVPVYGGSDLLGAGDAAQLEQWLDQGSISLTNIYDKEQGDRASDFHAAVDDRGATFSIIEVTGNYQGAFQESIIIGGYNPFSWSSDGFWRTAAVGDRAAFLFNLDTDTIARQLNEHYRGFYQTYNYTYYGPTFGNGHDLYISNNLTSGYAYGYAYGGGYGYHNSILGEYGQSLTFGQIEVFSINDSTAVPEPGMLGLMGIGFLGFLFAREKKRV